MPHVRAMACVLMFALASCSQPTKTPEEAKPEEVKPQEAKPPMPALPEVALQPAKSVGIDAAGLVTAVTSPQAGKLVFEVSNPGDTPRTFCDYHTPFEGVRNNIFEVLDAKGAAVEYRGIMAKRVAPTLANHWTVPARSRATIEFDLTKAYGLAAGTYKIRFTGNDISGLPASAPLTFTVAP